MAAHEGKIATCCYCGSRTTLVLTGRVQHELACGSCGAPLRNLKALPVAAPAQMARGKRPRGKAAPVPDDVWASAPPSPKRHKRRKKRRSVSRKLASEFFDLIEDILD